MKRGSPPKKPSGAEFKRRRKDAEALARKLLAEEKASGRADTRLERYAKLGDVTNDALHNISYANRAVSELLHTVMNDGEIDEATRRKAAIEITKAIGLTGVKAMYEDRLKRVEATLYGGAVREELDEVDGLEPDPTNDEKKTS